MTSRSSSKQGAYHFHWRGWSPVSPEPASSLPPFLWAYVVRWHYALPAHLRMGPNMLNGDMPPGLLAKRARALRSWALGIAGSLSKVHPPPADGAPYQVALLWGDDLRFQSAADSSFKAMEGIMELLNDPGKLAAAEQTQLPRRPCNRAGVPSSRCTSASASSQTTCGDSKRLYARRAPRLQGGFFPLQQAATASSVLSLPWTGYYSSRPALKEAASRTAALLRSVQQLQAMAVVVAGDHGQTPRC